MSAAKNTRGPWRVSLTDETLVLDADGDVVATTFFDGPDYEDNYERRSDHARLIASAPDLLEALHKLREPPTVTGDADTISAVMDLHELQCAVIDRALAKATQPSALVGEANSTSESGA